VGAYWDDSLRGAAYVFVRNGSAWTEEQKFVAGDGAAGHRFGSSVSLRAGRALIGSYLGNDGRGVAHVFVRSGGSWSDERQLVASDGAEGDLFGWSVSLADDSALVGAYHDDNLRGAAYVFSLPLAHGDDCSADGDCANGSNASGEGSGCECRAGGAPGHASGFWRGPALGLLLLGRRRRRARGAIPVEKNS